MTISHIYTNIYRSDTETPCAPVCMCVYVCIIINTIMEMCPVGYTVVFYVCYTIYIY